MIKAPTIRWGEDFDKGFYCKVMIPRAWLMEMSHLKRRMYLWWWLTKLVWTLPR
jgi:hypothetical protein